MIDGPVARKTGSASDFGSACLHSCHNCCNSGRTFYPNQKNIFYEKLGMKKSDCVMQYCHIDWTEWKVE